MCHAELEKINNFFSGLWKIFAYSFLEKLAEAKRKFAVLRDECDRHHIALKSASAVINSPAANDAEENNSPPVFIGNGTEVSDMDTLRRRRTTIRLKKLEKRPDAKPDQIGLPPKNATRKLHDLKLALSEFYLNLILLQNYQSLNFTGFRKILKKHDKVSFVIFSLNVSLSNWLINLVN